MDEDRPLTRDNLLKDSLHLLVFLGFDAALVALSYFGARRLPGGFGSVLEVIAAVGFYIGVLASMVLALIVGVWVFARRD